MTAPAVPHVIGWPRGVVKEGAADTQRTDEVASCDGYDIGPRGALIAARDASAYVTVNDIATAPGPWSKLYALRSVAGNNFTKTIAVGEGLDVATLRYLLASFVRENEASPVTGATKVKSFGALVPRAEGVLVTVAQFPGVYAVTNTVANINVFLVCIGARENIATNLAPGLYVAYAIPSASEIFVEPISNFDALGTGTRAGDKSAGTKGKQLFARGVAAYNAHAFCWGFDSNGGTDKEGPARLMFSNINNPLKWGNDNQAVATTDRDYTDSDAIIIGDGGEVIRAALTWNKRLWIGTDKQLHYVAGNGRDSFITDAANPIAKAENVTGPNSLIEGPDRQLYGVGELGLWCFNGETFERHHERLRDFAGHSSGYWDLIWSDPLRSATYPGGTNADLVWMAVDWDMQQVIVGIPWCDASSGSGYGLDTVLVKFNVKTGGFSRQVFSGTQFTAADYVRRQRQYRGARMLGTATAAKVTVQKYGDPNAGSTIPTPLPSYELGPYALYGPDGRGVYRKAFTTLAWESTSPGLAGWTLRTNPDPVQFRGVIWGNTHWVAAGNGIVAGIPTYKPIIRSTDGITWTAIVDATLDNGSWHRLARSATLGSGSGRLVVIHTGTHSDGDEAAYSDDDGATWALSTTPAGIGANWKGVAWSPTLALFVAVGGVAGIIMSSSTGAAWTQRVTPSASGWIDVAWSPALAKFIAISAGSGACMESADGITWTNHATFPVGNYRALAWAPEISLFVAVGDGGLVATSPDGVVWTTRTAAAALDWSGVSWSGSIFAAVSTSGTGSRIMTSPDGIVWTSQASPADNDWQALGWSSTLSMFASVATTGTGTRIMTTSVLPLTPDLAFDIIPFVDDEQLATVRLSVKPTAPAAPNDGDIWVDTSGTDTNIGNATAGTLISAAADYLVKRRYRGAWQYSGSGGAKGQRVTVPIAFTPRPGTRLRMQVNTITANRRWQFEGMGWDPAPISAKL